MSYEVEYRAIFADIEQCEWQIDILSDSYAGSINSMQLFGDALNIDFLSPSDRLIEEPIKGSLAVFNVLSRTDFQYSPLYAVSDFQYPINIYQGRPAIEITSWINGATYGGAEFSTFASSVSSITSAIHTEYGGAVCRSNLFRGLASGEKITLRMNLTLNDGDLPLLCLTDQNGSIRSGYHYAVEGDNVIEFTASAATEFTSIYIYNENYPDGTDDWSISAVSIDDTKSLFWSGWIVTGNYSEPYDGTSYVVSLAANDGLGVLRNIQYDNAGEYYDGRKLESEIILDILNKIAVTSFKEFINIYEIEQDATSDDSPLDQTMLDVDVFKDMSCYEVLGHILGKYNAIIRQRYGEYYIYKPIDLADDLVNGRHFTDVATKTSVTMSPEQWINRAGNASDLLNVEGGYLYIDPPAKTIKIFHDYGSKVSWLDNWEFNNETYKDGVWDYWEDINHEYSRPLSDYLPSEKEGIAIINQSIVTPHRVRQEFGQGFVVSIRDRFVLEFDYGFYNNTAGTINTCDLWLLIYGDASPDQYLQHKVNRVSVNSLGENDSDLEWGNADDDRVIKIIADCPSGWSGWSTFKRKFVGMPDVTSLTFDLFGGLKTSNVYCCYKNIKIYMADNDGVKMPSAWYSRGRLSTASQTYNTMRFPVFFRLATEKEYTFSNAIDYGIKKEYDVILGDVKNVEADNILEQYSGSIATYVDMSMQSSRNWSSDAGASYKDIITLKGDELKSHYSRPKQMITMPIIDKGSSPALDVLGRLTDSLNLFGEQERIFAINTARFNVRDRLWDVDLVEIIQPIPPVQPTVLVDESDDIETFTIDSYTGSIVSGSTSLTFEIDDPDGWATGAGVDMDYEVRDSSDNVLYSGTLDDVLDGGTFGETVTLSREVVAGETITIIIGIGLVVVTPEVSCVASDDIVLWYVEDAGGSIAIGNTSLSFTFYAQTGWAEPGSPVDMNYTVLDADDNELAYGTIEDVYDRLASWSDTASISRAAVSGDVFTVLLGTLAV